MFDSPIARLDRLKAETDAKTRVITARAEAEEISVLAKAHAAEARAQASGVTSLTVMEHAYDALGKLGGNGTTIMLGDWSRTPNFLFPHGGLFGMPGFSLTPPGSTMPPPRAPQAPSAIAPPDTTDPS